MSGSALGVSWVLNSSDSHRVGPPVDVVLVVIGDTILHVRKNKILRRATGYRSLLDVELALVLIYE